MKKGFSTGVAILVGLVLAGAMGLMLWQQYISENVEPQNTQLPQVGGQVGVSPVPQPTPTPQPVIPTPQNDAMAGWKTYRNDKYGFEVKYPRGSKIIEASSEWGVSPGGFHVDLPFVSGTGVSAKYLNTAILNVQPTTKKCFSVSEQTETIRLGSLEFEKLIGWGREYAGRDLYQTVNYSTLKDNKCFNFSFVLRSNGSPNMERESAIFSSLLTTFKFTR